MGQSQRNTTSKPNCARVQLPPRYYRNGCRFLARRQAQQPLESVMIYQHINIPTCKRTSMQTCKPITMVIYIAGSIPLFRGKRSNHFRLQRQSKHGALCRLKGQAAAPFPDKSSSRFAASVFIGKTLYPTAPYKRAFENGNDRPATLRPEGKNKVGLYG